MFDKKIVLLALLLLAPLTSSVHAANENHSGANCVADYGDIRFDGNGGVYNNSSTSNARVLCNLPHTDFDNWLNPGEVNSGWIQTVDLNNGQDISCRVRSTRVNSNGSSSASLSSIARTSGFGTARQHDTFGSVGEASNSAYVLSCFMPRRTNLGVSRLWVYRINQ